MSTLNTSIECVLFDLDGTLIDTAPDFQQAVARLTDEQGQARVSAELIHQTVSDGARALTSLALQMEQEHPDFTTHNNRLLHLYYEQLEHTEAELYPGLSELLDALESSGISWGIVTNKPELYTVRLLEKLQLLPRCRSVICPDHVSASKPNPEGILMACEQLNARLDRVVYIGDHVRDIQAAKNADVIAVAAAYGYLNQDAKVEQWYADFILREPQQTAALLERLQFA